MTILSLRAKAPGAFVFRPPACEPVVPVGARRSRLWELSATLHCSVIGTCLSTSDLRQLFAKLGHADAKTVSDHDLHARAVRASASGDTPGKMLDKQLDRRHDGFVRRFAAAKDGDALKAMWAAALDHGDVPGAYWAALTHPAATHVLVREIFGEVHMLSHLVGASNRADISRLRRLEADLADRDEKIVRQQTKLHQIATERDALRERLRVAEVEARLAAAATGTAGPRSSPDERLGDRLATEISRTSALTRQLREAEGDLRDAARRIAELTGRVGDLTTEVAVLEAEVGHGEAAPSRREVAAVDARVLYVGGRPGLIEQLRQRSARRGATFLAHDGGIENSLTLLPGLVAQADAVLFPVDCVSHSAAGLVKRLCSELQKPFVPLRTASVGSYLAAIDKLAGARASCHG